MMRGGSFVFFLLLSSSVFSKRVNTKDKNYVLREKNLNISKMKNSLPDQWKDLLNPKTREFWKEGNHIPDEGFLLLAQNPESVEYARYWLLRMEKKAEIMIQMQKTISKAQLELIREGLMEDRYWQFKHLKAGDVSARLAKNELEKLNYYFLFTSTCPHCKSLSKKITNLPKVRPLQIDKNSLLNFKGLSQTTRASVETIKSYAADGIVPVVVIHNPKTNVVTRITGNRPMTEYFQAANSLLKGKL